MNVSDLIQADQFLAIDLETTQKGRVQGWRRVWQPMLLFG